MSGTTFKDINLIVSQIALANMQTTSTLPTHQLAKKPPKIRLGTIYAGTFSTCKPFLSYFEALFDFSQRDGPDRGSRKLF